MKEQEVQVLLPGDTPETFNFQGSPTAFFRMIRALQNDGRNPHFRIFDPELKDWTCWQPAKAA